MQSRSCRWQIFLSPPSARRATTLRRWLCGWSSYFYPRPPRGGRRPALRVLTRSLLYFYPRPPRGGRRAQLLEDFRVGKISIPALREEGDGAVGAAALRRGISIPALREEGDSTSGLRTPPTPIFLSPPSARRATSDGGRRSRPPIFLSPPSARRATVSPYRGDQQHAISIPALREEGDLRHGPAAHRGGADFYPRPPRGGRPNETDDNVFMSKFLSPPSARRAT